MKFTYRDYTELIQMLQQKRYCFCDYHTHDRYDRCVILRHDIDYSLEKALTLAEVEANLGICSTWFVLLRSDFYNPASRKSIETIQKIKRMGHEIGLHFDEMFYKAEETDGHSIVPLILTEAHILSEIVDTPVTTVSMHRPSKQTLSANYEIPGMINSYGKEFFSDFKYLSDSRCRWREPVGQIVASGQYDRLHILTHAFWYGQEEAGMEKSVSGFISSAVSERYETMKANISDLEEIVKKEDFKVLVDN